VASVGRAGDGGALRGRGSPGWLGGGGWAARRGGRAKAAGWLSGVIRWPNGGEGQAEAGGAGRVTQRGGQVTSGPR
jgi:hypothetical protein